MGVQVAMARLAAMRMFPVFELDWHGNKAPVTHAAPRNNVIGNVLNRSRSPPQHGCPFRKFHPAWIRIVRQNHRIIESDVCDPVRARNVRRRPVQVAVPA